MSLFNTIFGKKTPAIKDQNGPANSSYKEDWDFYFSNVEGFIGSFYIDLGLAKIAPQSSRPNLVWISVKMNYPRKDGLSSNEEFNTLSEMEDRLQTFIVSRHQAVYAGRLTINNNRNFYFYLGDKTLCDKTISEAMVAFPSYTYDYEIKEDKEWESYSRFIYPNPKQLQSLHNRRVVDNLEKNGDTLTKARPVQHWVYFKTKTDRNLFLSKIEELHFDVLSKNEKTSFGDFPFKLIISRVDHVDHHSVDDYVLDLWQLATACNGDYDGWETSVEKD